MTGFTPTPAPSQRAASESRQPCTGATTARDERKRNRRWSASSIDELFSCHQNKDALDIKKKALFRRERVCLRKSPSLLLQLFEGMCQQPDLSPDSAKLRKKPRRCWRQNRRKCSNDRHRLPSPRGSKKGRAWTPGGRQKTSPIRPSSRVGSERIAVTVTGGCTAANLERMLWERYGDVAEAVKAMPDRTWQLLLSTRRGKVDTSFPSIGVDTRVFDLDKKFFVLRWTLPSLGRALDCFVMLENKPATGPVATAWCVPAEKVLDILAGSRQEQRQRSVTHPATATSTGSTGSTTRPTWAKSDSQCMFPGCECTFERRLRRFFVSGRHHCRACGAMVCGSHSQKKLALPHLDYNIPVRVCDSCFVGASPVS